MPPSSKPKADSVSLKTGDWVTVAATEFGLDWAKHQFPAGAWRTELIPCQVLDRKDKKWGVKFDDQDQTWLVLPAQQALVCLAPRGAPRG